MKIKNQKIVAIGLSIGLIVSAISPVVAETIGKADERKQIATESITPIDLEKIDLNNGLSTRIDVNEKNGETVTITKPLADCDTEDYIEMGKAGMSHDEVFEVLETAYEKGVRVKDVIKEVKKSNADKRVSKEKLKEKLGKLPNKKNQTEIEREEILKKKLGDEYYKRVEKNKKSLQSSDNSKGQKIRGPQGKEYDAPIIQQDFTNK